ncbi:uncharacterized protein E0L32_004086 [Thyridium curvatum]|uniref:Major facilitator superfamily (MFS) profile domain-containing protein n=1 Tax=Thyridium curvatum TaxID=1093900 RepID=A0A507BGH4_9PEZI|nr:uncharacterized protein E0L32_004086 [Thyridium curvatum]TPX16091.1 hypothetical protein E0L32_004086 [Thyridium curvatum]
MSGDDTPTTASSSSRSTTPVQDPAEELRRQRTIEQAKDEGHDADIPSSTGYILTKETEEKRKTSIALQRRHSVALARSRSQASAATRAADVEKTAGAADDGTAGGEEDDSEVAEENIVWWDGPDDPENPYNWPNWRKYTCCALISALTFVTPLGSSCFAPGVPELMREFKSTNTELAAFVVSVYVLGFAFGPMFMAPISEIYGRTVVYHVCNICFVAFNVGCALAPSLSALIVLRFLAGAFGSAPMTNGGGSIADMIHAEKRAGAMAAFSVGPLLGPIIGPVIGGFLSSAKGWRWVFWLIVMISGVCSVAMLLVLKETYAPVILERKAARLRKETGNDLLRSKLDVGLSQKDYFNRSIIRPMRILVTPIAFVFAIYMAVVFGYMYLLFTSVTYVFQKYYQFSTNIVGLTFLGLGVGSFLGMILYTMQTNRLIAKQASGGKIKPELRLAALPYGAVVLPIGFFIYGWTAQHHTHWIAPIIGMGVIGVGQMSIMMAIMMYLVDAYELYAASALAANTIIRSIAGATLPLCGLKMYDQLGLGWGNSLLGFIAVGMIPAAFIILKYGEYLRTRFAIQDL